MRHRKKIEKLNRTQSHKKALLNNLFTSLIMEESIVTTEAKAKALKRYADRSIARALKADLNTKRRFRSSLGTRGAYHKLFDTIVPQYKDRNGGYVRIIKMGTLKRGDGSPQSIVELV
ncbi:50S ribosomal protein L17 [candidate division WOR-3 bacterium]|nr:50S ribosomal protein L17 [candidate division WOR-3 bacterium]MCK4526799.1 50S ribosomal protein L17 [candidate division WOR-3 bacterium]